MSTLSMDMFGAPACTFCGGAQTVNCADCGGRGKRTCWDKDANLTDKECKTCLGRGGMQCKCVQGKIMPLMD